MYQEQRLESIISHKKLFPNFIGYGLDAKEREGLLEYN